MQIKQIVKHGVSFRVNGNESLYHGMPFWDAFQCGLWERATINIINRHCSPDRSFIDIGAWIGPTTLFGACIAQHVFSVEPDPVALQTLKTNIKLNHDLEERITIFEGALGDKSGELKIGNPQEFGNSKTSVLFFTSEDMRLGYRR